MDRRSYLALAGTAAVAGCISFGSEPEAAEDAWQDTSESQSGSQFTFEATVTLPEGTYTARYFEPQTARTLSIDAEMDQPVETFLVSPAAFQTYTEGDEFTHRDAFHGTGSQIQVSSDIVPGSYRLVVDNTAMGSVEPAGETTGNVVLTETV